MGRALSFYLGDLRLAVAHTQDHAIEKNRVFLVAQEEAVWVFPPVHATGNEEQHA